MSHSDLPLMIESQGLGKDFLIYHKAPGFKGSLQAFFQRQHERKAAVDAFDLRIHKGEIVGLLGPNGAGKTTLMKMFTGIIVPSRGTLRIAGYTPHERHMLFRRKIALVMGQKSQLWWDIPAMDSFLLLQKYYEVEDDIFQERLYALAELLDVKRLLQVHVRKLSLGERMKMELMASLMHQPEVLFLDEPTIGLDVVAQKAIREFILRWQREHQTTVILTSHYMADVAALCERIVLILGGKKRFDDGIQAFEQILGQQKFVSVDFERSVSSQEEMVHSSFWQALNPVWNARRNQVELRMPEASLRDQAIFLLQHYPVSGFSTEKLPIERVMNELLSNPELMNP